MSYYPALSLIPGYDAMIKMKDSFKMQRDYEKNVGRKVAYRSRRPDFGSVQSAVNQMYGSVNNYASMLPFGKNR